MLKLEIYKEQPEKDKTVRLAFKQESVGITVMAVDENGRGIEDGSLVTFQENGILLFHTDINKTIGFQLDEDGCIKQV